MLRESIEKSLDFAFMNARLAWAIHKMRFTLPKTHWRSRHPATLSNIRCRTGQKPKRNGRRDLNHQVSLCIHITQVKCHVCASVSQGQ
jgi:hypothetical protein